jgi:hypothetical protein
MEMFMNENENLRDGRSLAQIENDLLKAEVSYAEADARFQAALGDRTCALETINQHQMELDEAVAALRQSSIAGSRWKIETGEFDDIVMSNDDDLSDRSKARRLGPNPGDLKSCLAKGASRRVDERPFIEISM